MYCVSIIYSNRMAFLIHSNSDICSTSGGLSYMQKIDLIPLLSVGNGTEIAFMMQLGETKIKRSSLISSFV